MLACTLIALLANAAIPQVAEARLEEQLQLWENTETRQAAIAKMRAVNPEYDFMGRTFLVLALANVALEEPARADRALATIDRILVDTLAEEARHGQHTFLLPYGKHGEFRTPNGRSVFIDGEVAMMLGARRMVRDDRWAPEMRWRVRQVQETLASHPNHWAESYPNEAWIFCNVNALAALRMSDVLDGTDHSRMLTTWVAGAKKHLVDDQGALVSSFDLAGTVGDGMEGSSIWLAATHLRAVDPTFAAEQYQLAREALGRTVLGWGYAREWPQGAPSIEDVDSGPIVPGLQASASSSGFALLASKAFDDDDWHQALVRALGAAALLLSVDSELSEMADNQVADAVVLYGLVEGPLLDRLAQMPDATSTTAAFPKGPDRATLEE